MSQPDRLRLLWVNLGLTQGQMAAPLGVRHSKIRDIEHGKQRLTTDLAFRIKEKFSASAVWLMTGDGDMFAGGEG